MRMIKNEFIRNRSLSSFFFFFFLGWELVLIKKVDSVLYRPEFSVPVLRSEQKYGCFVPLQISGRTGRFGKNTGYRPENENRPVKCKPTVKKKKKRYPNPYCRFHFSGSDATSPIIVHLLFVFGSSSSSSSFVQSCSTSYWLMFLSIFFAFCFVLFIKKEAC